MMGFKKVLATAAIAVAALGVAGIGAESARADAMTDAKMIRMQGTGQVAFGLPANAAPRYSAFAYSVNGGDWQYMYWYYSEYGGVWDFSGGYFRAHYGTPAAYVGSGSVVGWEYRWYYDGSPYNGWVPLVSCTASDFNNTGGLIFPS